MRRWSMKVIAAGLLLGTWFVPAVGIGAPSEDGEAVLGEGELRSGAPNLAIWVEPDVPESERIGGWVEERGAEVLREHEPALAPEDLIRVIVSGEPYAYRIHVSLLRDERPLEKQPDVLVCECGSDEMLDRVGEAIDAGARRLTDLAEVEPEQAAVTKPVGSQEQRVDTRKRLRRMGYAGIGVGVLGAGLLAAGVPLALRPDELRGGPASISRYTTRPAGVGLAIGGGVALVTGIALVVVDAVRQRKPKVAIAPNVGARYAGVSITWKL